MKCPLTTGIISCLSKSTLSITQAHKQKVVREVEKFSTWSTEDKWTCSGVEGWDEIICWAQSLDWVVGKREGKLIFMNLNKLLCRANIHKCLLSNHSFIGLSCGFSNMFELIVVRLLVIIHFPLWNHCSKDDKYHPITWACVFVPWFWSCGESEWPYSCCPLV